jgi:SAP domain
VGSIKNLSPDDRYVPLIDRQVAAGETVDVPDDVLDPARHAWDNTVWDVTGGDPRSLAELKKEAERRDLPVSGTKRDLAERIAAHDAEQATGTTANTTTTDSTDESGE